jgi:Amidase
MASETGGSILGPAVRNGTVGLRPTYGRVPRTGAMTLCWTLHKLGHMARYVKDTLSVRPPRPKFFRAHRPRLSAAGTMACARQGPSRSVLYNER